MFCEVKHFHRLTSYDKRGIEQRVKAACSSNPSILHNPIKSSKHQMRNYSLGKKMCLISLDTLSRGESLPEAALVGGVLRH